MYTWTLTLEGSTLQDEWSSQIPNKREGAPDKVHRSQGIQKVASGSLSKLHHCYCRGETKADGDEIFLTKTEVQDT